MITHSTDSTTADEHSWGVEFDRLPGRTRGGYRLRLVLTDTDAADAHTDAADDVSPTGGITPPDLTVVNADRPQAASDNDSSPYQRAWSRYFESGYAPFPLRSGSKSPPPSGYTGTRGKRADTSQLIEWEDSPQYTGGNIGCWFGTTATIAGREYQLVGIDVDHYGDKHGGDQLKHLQNELAPLPETWISGARTDGRSGIRWFLAPSHDEHDKRIDFRAKADSAIDVIQRKHRYAVVWPSIHPDGGTYWWFPPGVDPDDKGRSAWNAGDDLPVLADLPVLPDAWVTYLREHRSHSGEIDLDISVSDLFDWTDDAFNDGKADEICWNIASAVETFKAKITDDESSHDKITDAHWLLFSLAAEGHTGWHAAVERVEQHWLRTVLNNGKRSIEEARSEVLRSRTGALRKIKVRVDREAVPAQCDCATAGANLGGGKGANVWHSVAAPLKVAQQFALINERDETPIRRWRGDWYRYDETRWKRLEDDEFNALLYERLDTALCLKAVKTNGVTTYEAVSWNPADRKVSAVGHALRSVVLIDSDHDAPRWIDGRKDHVIAFRNTLLRVDDRKQIEHTSAYFNVNVLPFDYDPAAPEPKRWIQFLSELWPDDAESIAALQEWFGYVISGRTNLHKMLTLVGPRRSGKTTIAHMLRMLVGRENQTECRSADIVSQFGMANLIGRTLAVFDDDRVTGSGKKFVDILKNIVGEGESTIDRKYQSAWRGRLGVRFVYIVNELSAIPDASGAIVERMIVLETHNSFEANPDRGLWRTLETELPGIFNWALDGLDRLTKQGEFTVARNNRGLVDEMHAAASPVTEFIGEKCVFDVNGYVSRALLYRMWRDWCSENGLTPGSMNSFLAKLRAAYGAKIDADKNAKRGPKGNQDRVLLGIEFKPAIERVERAVDWREPNR